MECYTTQARMILHVIRNPFSSTLLDWNGLWPNFNVSAYDDGRVVFRRRWERDSYPADDCPYTECVSASMTLHPGLRMFGVEFTLIFGGLPSRGADILRLSPGDVVLQPDDSNVNQLVCQIDSFCQATAILTYLSSEERHRLSQFEALLRDPCGFNSVVDADTLSARVDEYFPETSLQSLEDLHL